MKNHRHIVPMDQLLHPILAGDALQHRVQIYPKLFGALAQFCLDVEKRDFAAIDQN